MPEDKESSVLGSLKELRAIEEDRIRQEVEAEQARVDAERRAEEEKIRAAREAEERKRIEEEERLRKHEAEKERQIREEKLRLEETERRARIEAEAKVEQARIQAEIHAKTAKKAPIGLILGSVGVVVLIAAGVLYYVLGVYIPKQRAEEAARNQAQIERLKKEAAQQLQEELSKLGKIFDDQIANAKDEATKQKLLAEKARAEAEAKAKARKSIPASTKPKDKSFKLNCDPDKDPLCGI